MKLHEREKVDKVGDRRAVPGGWIYIEFSHPETADPAHCRMSTVFVPDEDAEHVILARLTRSLGGFVPGEPVIVFNANSSAYAPGNVATAQQMREYESSMDPEAVPVMIDGAITSVSWHRVKHRPSEATS